MTDPWTERFASREEAFRALESSEAGLSTGEAKGRLALHGENRILFRRTRSPLALFLAEFSGPFPLLLLAASLLSFLARLLGGGGDYGLVGAALAGVVLLNALVSFLQNYKAERLMISFLDYIPKTIALLRDGRKVLLDAKEAVPGDVLFLQEGDKIPADGILVEGEGVLVDESVLTGESEPVEKAPLCGGGDAARLLSGSTVLRGTGRILVARTGRETELGAVSGLSRGVKAELTPMQKELRRFVRVITALGVAMGAVLFAAGLLLGHSLWTGLLFLIGIIVANVPEGLLPTVTLALTQSSVRMSRRNAVVKQILSVETLGCTTVICTDKTGTLTLNRLHVEGFYLDFRPVPASDRSAFRKCPSSVPLLEAMALCNDAILTRGEGGRNAFKGDPNEVALAEFVDRTAGFEKLAGRFARVAGRSFSAGARYMSTTHRTAGGTLYMTVKGAPEVVLSRCASVHADGSARPMTEGEREEVARRAAGYGAEGLRVLAVAYKVVEDPHAEAEGLVLAGLVTMSDPPRPEVPAAVAACRAAGIRIVVMSGDRGETVAYLARRLGIASSPRVIEGAELASMTAERLKEELSNPQVVFARIAPEQKLAVVDAFKAMGEVVAVTGDGVNDAPALKRADIGISMGMRGTDVAKEASDIILLDDNFATIVRAIEEGRAVYDNIRKFIAYILTHSMPEVIPYVAFAFLPIPLPLTVAQILSIDLFTEILPAVGLGNEPPESDLMSRPPRRQSERLVTGGTFVRSFAVLGLTETALAFAAYFLALSAGGWSFGDRLAGDPLLYRQAAGAYLAAIVFAQGGNVLACRTNRQSAFSAAFRPNRWIAAGIAVEGAFIVSILAFPALGAVFSARPFGAAAWAVVLAAPFVVFLVEEGRKKLARGGASTLSA